MNNKNDKSCLIPPLTTHADLIVDRSPDKINGLCATDHEHTILPENKQTIVVDWLTLSFLKLLPEISQIMRKTRSDGQYDLNPDCYLLNVNKGINGFKHTTQIYLHGKLLGKLLINPDNGLPKNTVHLIIENSRFYTNDYVESIDYLIDNLNFNYNHLVRLDIALDFIKMFIYVFLHRFDKSPNIFKRGKARYKVTKQGKTIVGFKIGSALSDKELSAYNKTKDLLRKPKPYLIDYWTANGMNHTDNVVERIELRLKTKELKNIDYRQLKNLEYLLGICKLHFKDYFQFDSKYIQNYKMVAKDVTPIDISFSGLKAVFLTKIVNLPKLTSKALKTQTHHKVDDILFEQLAQDNETDLTKINPENLDIAMLSLERFLNVNPEMREYQSSRQKTWEKQFRIKNLIYQSNIHNTANDEVLCCDIINDTENEIEDGNDSENMCPNVKIINIQEYTRPKIDIDKPFDQIYLKYRSLPNIQYIVDLYNNFVSEDEANNSKVYINDYIQLALYLLCDYSKDITSECLNLSYKHHSLKDYNKIFNSIFQKLISKEYDINHYSRDLVA